MKKFHSSLPISESFCSLTNWLPEEDFNVISADFFDDLLNPIEVDEDDSDDEDWESKFKNLEPPPMDIFSSCVGGIEKPTPIFKQSTSCEALSNTVHQSLSPPLDVKVPKMLQSSSPMSVLESNDGTVSSQNGGLAFPVKGVRTKRKRPSPRTMGCGWICHFDVTPGESESLCYCSSEQSDKKKLKTVFAGLEASETDDGIVRKCSHCETTKTPQWREGPNGPKTLCNACGVRYRSGRLLPEYRPASSPTFVPSMHSNSHRKIIAMRKKDNDQFEVWSP